MDEDTEGATRAARLADAAAVGKLLVTAFAGVDGNHVLWRSLRDAEGRPSGLLDSTGHPKPGACAFATASRLLAGARLQRDESDEESRRFVFDTPSGSRVLIAWWGEGKQSTLELRPNGEVQLAHVLGHRRPLASQAGRVSIPLSEIPVFIAGNL